MIKSQTVSFYTFGCRLNQSETAVIENSFRQRGYQVAPLAQNSDIIVINTCTVTEGGDADTRRLVSKINRLNPQAKIALVGCQAQMQKEQLAKLPNVKWVVGNERKMELATILHETPSPANPLVVTPTISRQSFTVATPAVDHHHTRANLKIQDGCDFFCSFCEIPYARGRARSRKFLDILKEAKILANAGHKEVIITGINVGTYQYEGKTLLDVIEGMADISGIKRIRISSIEPTTIPQALIRKMQSNSKLCRYLHIPLQSGHNAILSNMKRRYTLEEFAAFIQMADEQVPGICIGTDMIVGFPGEEDEHFSSTYEYLANAPIDYFHVFSYSPRSMAKSKELDRSIPTDIIQRRSQFLRELSTRKRQNFYRSFLGETLQVLFEEQKEGHWTGWTDNYIRVAVLSEKNLQNSLHPVKLLHLAKNGVVGELL